MRSPWTYTHFVGSLHLYEENIERSRDYLAEGWQTPISMPPMPAGNPEASLTWLLQTEEAIRLGSNPPDVEGVDAYWVDLARLLRVKSLLRHKDMRAIARLKSEMSSEVYSAFIRGRELAALEKVGPQLELPGIGASPAVMVERESETE